MENSLEPRRELDEKFFVFGGCINIWLSAGLGFKNCYFGGAGWGGRGKSKTKKSVVGVYSGVGYDFGRGASGETKEVCVPCTNAGHFIPQSTYEDLDLIF